MVFIDEGRRNTPMKMVASQIAELEMQIRNVFAYDFALSEAAEGGKRLLQADIFISGGRGRNQPVVLEGRTNFTIGPKSPASAARRAEI